MKSRRIALITARADDGEQRDIIYGAADECRKNGFGLAVFSDLYNYWTDDPLLSFENIIYSFFDPMQFAGVIITYEAFRDIGILDGLVKKVRRAKLPAAVIGGKIKGFASIFSDDAADLENMAEHLGQYRTTPVRQIARKLNKVELRFFVRVHKFDAGGLTPGKENLCAMTENMQADDVQRRKPRVVRCCPCDLPRAETR